MSSPSNKIQPSQSTLADRECSPLPAQSEKACRKAIADRSSPFADRRSKIVDSYKLASRTPRSTTHDPRPTNYKSGDNAPRRLPDWIARLFRIETPAERLARISAALREGMTRLKDYRLPINFPPRQEPPVEEPPVEEPPPIADAGAPDNPVDPDAGVAPPPNEDAAPVDPPDDPDQGVPEEPDAAPPPPQRPHFCDGNRGEFPMGQAVRFVPERVGEYQQTSMAVGDVNGDGIDDVVVGALLDEKAYVLFGREDEDRFAPGTTINLAEEADVVFEGQRRSGFGGNVALYDLNNDGIQDIFIGSGLNFYAIVYGREVYSGVEQNGQTRITLGRDVLTNPENLAALDMAVLEGGEGYAIGSAIQFPGDVNGDEVPDMIVTHGGGSAEILPALSLEGITSMPELVESSNQAGIRTHVIYDERFLNWGRQISVADLDGDGHKDLLITSDDTGRTRFVKGGPDLPQRIVLPDFDGFYFTISGNTPNWATGDSTSMADLDGDGHADLIVAAPGAPYVDDQGQARGGAGAVFMISGVNIQQAIEEETIQSGEELTVDELVQRVGGFKLYGNQENGQVGYKGLAVTQNGALIIGAALFNNNNGCVFTLCANSIARINLNQVSQRTVAQVDRTAEGEPGSQFGSNVITTPLGVVVQQGNGVIHLFRNP